jgi:hypothetical protein
MSTTLTKPYQTSAGESSRKNVAWYLLFLEHLDEFATLAWYLVADHQLVEETILRTMALLDTVPFDASTPQLAYTHARETLITEAISGLGVAYKHRQHSEVFEPGSLGELPDLPRLAFMLKLVLRSSEAEVAKFLGITPAKVRELVQHAIDRLSLQMPFSVLTGCYDA